MIHDLDSEQLEDFLLSTCVDETGVPNHGTLWEFSNGTNVLTYKGHRHVFFWRTELVILDKETDSLDDSAIMNLGVEGTPETDELSTIYELALAIDADNIGITDRVDQYLTNKPKSSRYSYNFDTSVFTLYVELMQGLTLHQSVDRKSERATLSLSYDLDTVGSIDIYDVTTVYKGLKLLTRRFQNRTLQPLLEATSVKSEKELKSEADSDRQSMNDILDDLGEIPGIETILFKVPSDSPITSKIRNGRNAISDDDLMGTRAYDITLDSPEEDPPSVGKDFFITSRIVDTPASSENLPIDEVMRLALADFEKE